MKNLVFLLLIGINFLTSCKDKEDLDPVEEVIGNYVNIEVQPVFDSETLYLDSIYLF